MPWSLGVLGDLTWNVFPEFRPAIKDLICERVQRSIDTDVMDQQLEPLAGYEFLVFVIGRHVLLPIDEGTADPTLIQRLCAFIAHALTYQGPEAASVHYDVRAYVIEHLDTPAGVARMGECDRELVEYVRSRFPGAWQG